jgi:uncharacterized protein YjbI with pentapeptide repeats
LLEECRLENASLFAATLHHARFNMTDLTSSLLVHAQGTEALFQDATLDNANFSFADFTSSNFNGAGMSGIYEHDTVFEGASFEGAMR